MDIVIACFAFALFALAVYCLEQKLQKTRRLDWILELEKNQRIWEAVTINKKSIKFALQENELKYGYDGFNDSDLRLLEAMLSGSSLNIHDVRSGAYVTDLLEMYKDLTLEPLEEDKREERTLTEITIVKKPKDYWDCYSNLNSAASLVLGEVYVKILAVHIDALARRREQLIITDDYGHNDCEQWISEKKRFIKNIATPYISKKFNSRRGPNFKLLLKFIEGPNDTEMPDFTFNMMDYYIDELLSARPKKNDNTFNAVSNGRDYEHYVSSIFKKHSWNSRVTKGSGDQGADIVATKKTITIVAQCKFYSSPVGNKSVQEIYSAKGYYDGDIACVVTNQSYTKAARSAAGKLGVYLLHHDQIEDFLKGF